MGFISINPAKNVIVSVITRGRGHNLGFIDDVFESMGDMGEMAKIIILVLIVAVVVMVLASLVGLIKVFA